MVYVFYKSFSMWKYSLLFSILFFELFLECLSFTQYVDLNQPITLRTDAAGITTMSFIQDGPASYHYYVAFADGGLRAYLEDYSSYSNFTTYSVVTKVVGSPFAYTHYLADGSAYYFQTYIITTLSNSLELANYLYEKSTPILRLVLNETILAFKSTALPTNSSVNLAPFNVVICSDTIFLSCYS